MRALRDGLFSLLLTAGLLAGCVLDRAGGGPGQTGSGGVDGMGGNGAGGGTQQGGGGASNDCGDGTVQMGEECDDGNADADDGCAQCVIEEGWNCVGAPSVCTAPCGDGIVVSAAGELCDDGNTNPGDGCDDSCQIETGYDCNGTPSLCTAICGDGLIIEAETCDDGNMVALDGCDDSCQIEDGWNCMDTPSVCTSICGDWLVVGTEQCDDGGTATGDGCDDSCLFEATCGNGAIEPGEQCDDGGTAPGDGCDGNCVIEAGETCGLAIDLNNAAFLQGDTLVYDGDTTSMNIVDTDIAAPTCSPGHDPDVPAAIHRYTLQSPGRALIRFDYVRNGVYDTILNVYDDCLLANQINCNDDVGGSRGDRRSQIATGTHPAGTNLYIQVTGWQLEDAGPYRLRITELPIGPKLQANTSSCNAPLPASPGDVQRANLPANNTGSLTHSCGGVGAAEAVYQYTPASAEDVTILGVGLEPNHNLVLATMDGCGTSERQCATTAQANFIKRLTDESVPAGNLFIAMDALTGGIAGHPAMVLDTLPLLATGAACTPGDVANRCEDNSACSPTPDNTCRATLTDERFDTGLGSMAQVSLSGASAWFNCNVGNCNLFNTPGSRSGKPFARITDSAAGNETDVLLSGPHNGSAMNSVIVELTHSYFNQDNCPADSAAVGVSLDGTSFTPVQTWTSQVYTAHEVIDVSAEAAGQAQFYIGFRYTDGGSCVTGSWNIDDVRIYGY